MLGHSPVFSRLPPFQGETQKNHFGFHLRNKRAVIYNNHQFQAALNFYPKMLEGYALDHGNSQNNFPSPPRTRHGNRGMKIVGSQRCREFFVVPTLSLIAPSQLCVIGACQRYPLHIRIFQHQEPGKTQSVSSLLIHVSKIKSDNSQTWGKFYQKLIAMGVFFVRGRG